MVVKKKRTAEEANLNQDSSPSSEELRELCRLVKSEVVIELAHLKQLKTLLKRMSKEVQKRSMSWIIFLCLGRRREDCKFYC